MLGYHTGSNSASAPVKIQGLSFPQEHRSQAGWRGIFSSQNVTPANCSGEQRQAPERSQLLTSQCKNKSPFPLCLFWQFHVILPGIQSANHPSGSPCSGNEDTSYLPLPFFTHYFLCAATIDVVPSEQPENALPLHRNLQEARTSPLTPTENHPGVFLLNLVTSKRSCYPR